MKKLTAEAKSKSKSSSRVCDLCHEQQPSLYCSSDSAFLCFDCDSQVHTANFLVARHIRFSICSLCKSYHDSTCVTSNCHDDASSSSSSSSSSTVVCLSSTTELDGSTKTSYNSKTTTSSKAAAALDHVSSDWKTRDVLVEWCTRLGSGSGLRVIEVARHAFQVWYYWLQDRDHSVWPYRVGLAASLWLGLLRFTEDDNNNNDDDKRRMMRMRSLLKRLEEISGVPAKSIVVAQSKLAAAATFKHRRQQQQQQQLQAHQLTRLDVDATPEESWAEC